MWLYHRVISPKGEDGMASSVDPDQTAPLEAVWSGSTPFAQTSLSENGTITVDILNDSSFKHDCGNSKNWVTLLFRTALNLFCIIVNGKCLWFKGSVKLIHIVLRTAQVKIKKAII